MRRTTKMSNNINKSSHIENSDNMHTQKVGAREICKNDSYNECVKKVCVDNDYMTCDNDEKIVAKKNKKLTCLKESVNTGQSLNEQHDLETDRECVNDNQNEIGQAAKVQCNQQDLEKAGENESANIGQELDYKSETTEQENKLINENQDIMNSENNISQQAQENVNNNNREENILKVYEKADWQNRVDNFFESYPNAVRFAAEIGNEIIADDSLSNNDTCLEKAFLKILSKEYRTPEEYICDENFKEKFVLNNKEIESIIIERYLEQISHNNPPKTITARGQIALTPTHKPKNIEDAGKVINMMFKNRRI